ncbi:MAG: fibronectin type III domain-containing protein [Acidobacteria bacterium]|nr:fibronectin type III domain-containing protein [Acidobacteriota bacterium]
MSKRKSAGRKSLAPRSRRRVGKVLIAVLALCLLGTVVTLLGRKTGVHNAPTQGEPPPVNPPTPTSFSPSSPSREYIYAGGRLIASEEPLVLTPPAAPTLAQAGGALSGLWWTDNSNNETGFKIESCHLVNGVWTQWQQIATVGANVVNYKGSLGCEYKYRVRATNAVGDSAYSNEVSPKPPCWVTGSDAPPAENVIWSSVVGVQPTGNSLRKVSGTSSWYDAGAVSTRTIASGTGYVEFTPGNAVTWRMVGLGNGNSSQHFGDIEYALFLGGGSDLHIYEAGQYRGQFGAYAANDLLKVAVENGQVRYYRNDVLLYLSAVAPSYPLLVDTSLNTVNSEVNNVKIAAASFGGVAPPQGVFWTAVSPNIRVSGNSIQKVAGAASWYDAGAASSRTIASGDGYMEFTPGDTSTWRMIGLNSGAPTWYFGDIEHALFMGGSSDLHVYEAGQYRGQFGTYAANDRLKIAVEGGVVRYYRNGAAVYTSGVAPVYPLMADASLNTVNAGVYDVQLAAAVSGGTPPPENVAWTAVTPTLQVTGNTVQKVSGGASWYDAGAVSNKSITSGDGYVEFTPGHTSTWRMCGLGRGNDSAYFGDIEYALFLGGGGTVHVYESGVYRGEFGTYAANDRLKVAVESGQVRYYRNATLLYTSAVAPIYPLLADTSFNTVNSAVYNVWIAGTLTP